MQDAAYSTLLRPRRQHLHGRIAMTLERQFPELAVAQPELMAQHCAMAGLVEQAIEYWDKAGRLAVQRSTMAEAAAHFGKALELLAGLPKNSERQSDELSLRLALAGALTAAKGWASPEARDQLDLQALHRVRERLVGQRTGVINQIRAFLLERSIAVRQGLRSLRSELPGILATRTDVLSPRMLRIIEDLAGDWRRLDERIEDLSSEIEAIARQDKGCDRLMTVPGIGPIISSAMVAAIGTGDVFPKGRDFGAWLGLVPKQISTGDRTILGKISRRGNRYRATALDSYGEAIAFC